jgi:hypothetical protein
MLKFATGQTAFAGLDHGPPARFPEPSYGRSIVRQLFSGLHDGLAKPDLLLENSGSSNGNFLIVV